MTSQLTAFTLFRTFRRLIRLTMSFSGCRCDSVWVICWIDSIVKIVVIITIVGVGITVIIVIIGCSNV